MVDNVHEKSTSLKISSISLSKLAGSLQITNDITLKYNKPCRLSKTVCSLRAASFSTWRLPETNGGERVNG